MTGQPPPTIGTRRIINASGTMTALGASRARPAVVEAVAEILPRFVAIDALQAEASRAIARATGAEAGFVTASSAAGITLAVAATMTGPDLARIEQLPDAAGMKDEILIPAGHVINYGAPIDQAVRLAGAVMVPFGQATEAQAYQLQARLGPLTAALLYVVSHHTAQLGQVTLAEAVALCRRHGVPVIVDAASEYDLRGFLAGGADLAIYSAHKFLGGATAGIVAGRKDLVRAAYLQNRGIGRGMKVGKEGIAGAIAAVTAWEQRDAGAIRAAETARIHLWQARLAGLDGVWAEVVADPTGNPIDRLCVHVDPAAANETAWGLADRLWAGEPAIAVREELLEHGCFELDPCNLEHDEAALVADRIRAALAVAAKQPKRRHATLAERRAAALRAALAWPDQPAPPAEREEAAE